MTKLVPVERIYLSLQKLEEVERDILDRRHIERYAMCRQWCYGNVLDFACGCGYGSYLISKNPDVHKVYAVDNNLDAISWALSNYKNDKIKFLHQNIDNFEASIDTMICLETIEHIQDQQLIAKNADRLQVQQILLSFPSKKTTHYNPFHFYDYTTEQIQSLLTNYNLVDEIDLHREVKILKLIRK